jgi:hypothetical protein
MFLVLLILSCMGSSHAASSQGTKHDETLPVSHFMLALGYRVLVVVVVEALRALLHMCCRLSMCNMTFQLWCFEFTSPFLSPGLIFTSVFWWNLFRTLPRVGHKRNGIRVIAIVGFLPLASAMTGVNGLSCFCFVDIVAFKKRAEQLIQRSDRDGEAGSHMSRDDVHHMQHGVCHGHIIRVQGDG